MRTGAEGYAGGQVEAPECQHCSIGHPLRILQHRANILGRLSTLQLGTGMRGRLFTRATLQDALRMLQLHADSATAKQCGQLSVEMKVQQCPSRASRWYFSSSRCSVTTSASACQSSTVDIAEETHSSSNSSNSMEFPGGRVPFTDQLSFEGGPLAPRAPISCYRTLDSKGSLNSPLAQYSIHMQSTTVHHTS